MALLGITEVALASVLVKRRLIVIINKREERRRVVYLDMPQGPIECDQFNCKRRNKISFNREVNMGQYLQSGICYRIAVDKDQLNDLFNKLLEKRHQVAGNAGFENYRDYKFADLGRFDYKKEDCFQFHDAVKSGVLPLVDFIYDRKRQKLGLKSLRPWDTEAEPEGIQPLHPFETGEELVNKTIECFNRMNPFFGECLVKMKEMGRLDLDQSQIIFAIDINTSRQIAALVVEVDANRVDISNHVIVRDEIATFVDDDSSSHPIDLPPLIRVEDVVLSI